jgi:hypothetical protein
MNVHCLKLVKTLKQVKEGHTVVNAQIKEFKYNLK